VAPCGRFSAGPGHHKHEAAVRHVPAVDLEDLQIREETQRLTTLRLHRLDRFPLTSVWLNRTRARRSAGIAWIWNFDVVAVM